MPEPFPSNANEPEMDQDKNPQEHQNSTADEQAPEPVWTYRGYQLRGSDFNTAMVHLFRAEVSRANVWRQRLDATTNWAVITTGALLTFIFGATEAPHLVILVNLLMVTIFLIIEGRRYRYYELWSYRVRLMETDFFAPMLVPPFHPSPEWAEALAENLLHPHFPISTLEAVGRRLRRNYLWIYIIIAIAWSAHLWWKPVRAETWQQFTANASFAGIPGEYLLILGVVCFSIVFVFGLLTARLQEAAGEVLPRYAGLTTPTGLSENEKTDKELHAWFRPTHRRRQLMTMIITDREKEVTERILSDLRRGVTSMPGKGMYTGKSHSVLLCALTVTEVPQLKALVNDVDPNAFVILTPAQEVFGKGFMPLK